jgi:hypothetical protein
MTRRHQPLGQENPDWVLEEVVEALNEGKRANSLLNAKAHRRLTQLFKAWKDSGEKTGRANWNRMKVPTTERYTNPFELLWHFAKGWDYVLVPTYHGQAYVSLRPLGGSRFDIVGFYFIRFALCSKAGYLGGPCAHCGRWYVKKTLRPSVFCTTRCAGNATKARERSKAHADQIEVLQQAVDRYQRKPLRWRERHQLRQWLKNNVVVRDYGISKKFITQSINSGEVNLATTQKRRKPNEEDHPEKN